MIETINGNESMTLDRDALEQNAESLPVSGEPSGRPRLLIADDHVLLLDGLKRLLEKDFDLVASVTDGYAAVAAAEQFRPDVVLMDIGLPLLNGLEAARQIRRVLPETRLLFVTMQTERIYVEEAFRAGGAGYVLKQAAGTELLNAIRTVLTGERYLSPRIGVKLDKLEAHPAHRRTVGGLTARQREVLQLVAEGKSMKEIAWILRISVRTVEFHKQSLFQDLGIRTTAELIRYALDQKIAV
ncbi:MAG TPA: response regulator transcription factor [Bryobacteraceae bacterium]|nr:response regulator transcription factor [Bryobacteraceae bacterium]